MVRYKLTFLGKSIITCFILAFILIGAKFNNALEKQDSKSQDGMTSAQEVNDIGHEDVSVPKDIDKPKDVLIKDTSLQTKMITYFEPDSAVIAQKEYQQIDDWIDVIENSEDYMIYLEGNCATLSAEGDTKLANILSLERARAVAEYLKYRNIDMNRITIIGNGARNPLGENSTEKGRVLNRRVDAYLKKSK
ncbi:MAG: OmpA family protein, partial [Clostridia bacterium]